MRKVRELFRLKFEQNFSIRAASSAVGMGKTAGSGYIACFGKSGLSISDLPSLSDDELIQAITPVQDQENERYKHLCS
jgi:hypothetical protein